MANEARVFARGPMGCRVLPFIIADATAIPKGSLMVYGSASRTAVLHGTSLLQRPLGFATSSKLADDGITEIGLQRSGSVEAVADGVITTGDLVVISRTTANRVESIATGGLLSLYQDDTRIVGRAITSAADAGRVEVDLSLSS